MLYPVKATYDIMALLSAFGIAYRLAEKYRTLDPLSAGAMSLVAFVMTIPQVTLFTPADGSAAQIVKGVLPVGMIGSQGTVCGDCDFAALYRDLSPGGQP
ncbi:PTS system protein [Klebsiella oxytoca]|nr:PTS system protein [Klebsiella oxytoca]